MRPVSRSLNSYSHHSVNIFINELIKVSSFALLMDTLIKYLFQQITFAILINPAAV